MVARVQQDYIDSLVLLRQCIDSINKSIMLDSVDMINQSGHLRRLYETYDKVFDYVFQIISGNAIMVPEIFPGGLDTDYWITMSLAQDTMSHSF